MLYDYEVKYSDGSVVKNVYSMPEDKASEQIGKEIRYHFLYGDKSVSVVSAKVIAVQS